jgi:uncharacterized protein (TIGR03435 family)
MIGIAWGSFIGWRWDGIPLSHVEGGPSWVDMDSSYSNSYTINAKDDGTASEEMTRGPMFRAILEDRFGLKVREETRRVTVYALTVDRRGSKLKSFDETCTVQDVPLTETPKAPFAKPLCTTLLLRNGSRRTIDMTGWTLGTFVSLLSRFARAGGDLDGPIVDRTGLSAYFDIHLEYGASNPLPGDDAETLPVIARALEEQLGLRLERTTGPDEFLVIEHVERPSEN